MNPKFTKFFLYIGDEKRRKFFSDILGDELIPIRSPDTFSGKIKDKVEKYYRLDFNSLDEKQKEKLIQHIVTKLKVDYLKAINFINFQGIPILAKNCLVYKAVPKKYGE